MRNTLFFTNAQKILAFMAGPLKPEYTERDILSGVKVSRPGVNLGLKELMDAGLVSRVKKGGTYFYTVEKQEPVIKQLKTVITVITLRDIIVKLRGLSEKVILFGSASRGENTGDSDIDLFVVSQNIQAVEKIVSNEKINIQLIVKTPVRYAEQEKKEPDFSREVERGIILWQKTE